MIRRVLIANRGEIAIRIARACRENGLQSVAVFSDCDRRAPHVSYCDQAFYIGGNPPRESYLNIERVLDAARQADADAIHPGYGFLSENEDFAAACEAAGLTFIGPRAETIATMGSKTAARDAAQRAGVPVVPGTEKPLPASASDAELTETGKRIGYPLLVKAVAGGGGKGMRTVSHRDELLGAVRAARSEADAAFGDPSVYLERKVTEPRHIEVQLLGDVLGEVVAFVERECSIQRRHQKVVEESPSPVVSSELRRQITDAAVRVAKAVGYVNAGTIEFLLDRDGSFYFLEMNTRLQVEHPITEAVTGTDLVQWQIRIANGERLKLESQRTLVPSGHAIECRIYAEDPDNGFLPSPGPVLHLRQPSGPGIRDDSGVAEGFEVPIYYDPMVSKLIAWGSGRNHAIARMRRAVSEYEVLGIKTTLPFFRWLLVQPEFGNAQFSTTYLDEVIRTRAGAGFTEVSPHTETMGVVAAVLDAMSSASRTTAPGSSRSAWNARARAEGLRS